jgi:hypothetical protein
MDYLHPPLQCVCWVRLSQSHIQLRSFAVDNTIITVEIIHNSTNWAVLLVKSLIQFIPISQLAAEITK